MNKKKTSWTGLAMKTRQNSKQQQREKNENFDHDLQKSKFV